jgi:hypothetical protein
MSATAHLPRLAPSRPPHETWLTRLRLRLRRDDLDRKLLAGADPRRRDDLERRAEELTGAEERRRILTTAGHLGPLWCAQVTSRASP